MLKRFAMFLRSSIKLIVLIVASIILITAAITIFYKPTYEVSLNGELIGYTSDKSNLQERINKYVESGNGDDVVFAQIDSMPKYKLCLLKKDVQTNDDEIYTKVTSNGTEYYRFYAITDNKEEKYYVSTFKEAEDIVKKLKDKDSANKNDIGILEKYDKTKKDDKIIDITFDKINKVLGLIVPREEVINIFKKLKFQVEEKKDTLRVTVPSRRIDISIKEDLIEEVGRFYGLSNIVGTLPTVPL